MENLDQYYQIVETAVKSLGVDPEKCRDDKEQGAWALMKGEQEVWLDCWYIEEEERVYFQALSPVLEVPNDMPAPFYRESISIKIQMLHLTQINRLLVSFVIQIGYSYFRI